MLTGEGIPVAKTEGDELIGGTVNGGTPLRMRVDRTGGETVLAQIIGLVERAQAEKLRSSASPTASRRSSCPASSPSRPSPSRSGRSPATAWWRP